MKSTIGAICFCGMILHATLGGAVERGESVEMKFDNAYQNFVDTYRDTESASQRLELIRNSNQSISKILEEHLDQPQMKKLLPKMVAVRLLNLDESFATVIDEHPNSSVRALALLCFAKYCGNNGRDELAKRTLAYLKKKYDQVPHDDQTFGKAAEEAFYFLTKLTVGKKAPEIAGQDADGILFRSRDYPRQSCHATFLG